MAQAEITRARAPDLAAGARRLTARFLDWEDWLTFALALGAMLGVSMSLERSGWSSDMPALTLVGVPALLLALLAARSPLHMLLAWPLAAAVGAAVVFWQTMEMVGPGDLAQRIDAVYFRFQTWFDVAFSGRISNDSLPFNTMVVGLTWLGVFLFGWSVYRWNNAWLGLIPGGVALFMNLVLIDDSLPFAVFMYVMCGFLLVMRTNLMDAMRRWRREGVSYPPLISLSFLHFTLWAGLFLMAAAWIAPVGPWPTPAPVDAVVERFEGFAVHFARLAGPLHVKRVVPAHDYTAVLPFQGSIDLSERELLSVTVGDPSLEGPLALRGAVYDEYASGGWNAGRRDEAEVPRDLVSLERLGGEGFSGRIVPITVTVEAKSVVGTVLFTPGQPLSASVPARAKLAAGSVTELSVVTGGRRAEGAGPYVFLPSLAGEELTDAEALTRVPPAWTGLYVRRDDQGRIARIGAVRSERIPDVLVLSPRQKLAEGESYSILGLVRDVDPYRLRAADRIYPYDIRDRYLQLPEALPERVSRLARDLAASATSPYDRARAIEDYLRGYPVDYAVGETPPGEDTVDYFLFQARRGYFSYHASAMVVMLRAVGIPARLAVGFVVDQEDLDEEALAYVVQDKDAYAWPEVYFPGEGWIAFNPTPDRPSDLRPREGSGDIVVPPLSLEDIEGLPVSTAGLFPPFDDEFGADGGASASGGGGLPGPGRTFWLALAAAGGLVAAVIGSTSLGWRRSVAGLPYSQQVWEKTVRLAAWAGHPLRPGDTPATFARRLQRDMPALGDLSGLAEAYNRSRYGEREPGGEERQELRRLWPRLRNTLLGGMYVRLWGRWW